MLGPSFKNELVLIRVEQPKCTADSAINLDKDSMARRGRYSWLESGVRWRVE